MPPAGSNDKVLKELIVNCADICTVYPDLCVHTMTFLLDWDEKKKDNIIIEDKKGIFGGDLNSLLMHGVMLQRNYREENIALSFLLWVKNWERCYVWVGRYFKTREAYYNNTKMLTTISDLVDRIISLTNVCY